MDKYSICQIDWVDPHSIDEWINPDDEELDQITHITSFGFLIKETDSAYVISLNHDHHNGKLSCSMVIPKVCVKRIRNLNVG